MSKFVKVLLLFLLLFAFAFLQVLCGNQITICTSNGTKLEDFIKAGKPSLRFQIEPKKKLEREFLCPHEAEIIVKKLAESMVLDDYHLVIQKESDKNNCSKIMVLGIANWDIESSSSTTVKPDPITSTTTPTTTTTEGPKYGRIYKFNGITGTRENSFGVFLKHPNASDTDHWLDLMIDIDKGIEITTKNTGQISKTTYGCFGIGNKFECYDDRTEMIRYNADKQKPLPESLANASVQIDLEIHHYFVQIQFTLTIKDELYNYGKFNQHWPTNWLNGLEGAVAEELVPGAIGQFEMTYDILKKENESSLLFKKAGNYHSRKFMQEFTNGSKITFRGILEEEMQKFSIKLLRNARQMLPNQKIGDIVLQIDIDFTKPIINLNSQVNGKLSNQTMSYDNTGTLKKIAPFECQILAVQEDGEKHGFKVDFMQASGGLSLPMIKSPLPHWAVNYINIIDDKTSLNLEYPIIEYGMPSNQYKLEYPLRIGSKIEINLYPREGEKYVDIFLLHGVSEYNAEVGNVPLHIRIEKLENSTNMADFFVNSLNRKTAKEFSPRRNLGPLDLGPLFSFPLYIVVMEEQFELEMPQIIREKVGSYLYSESNLPPWTVDHISVSSKMPFRNDPEFPMPKNSHIGEKDVPFTKPLDTSAYKADSPITIILELTVISGDGEGEAEEGKKAIFSINFLNGGIFWDKYAVKTPLRFEFYEHHFMCIIEEDGKVGNPKKEPYADQIKLQPKTKLNLEISLLEKGGYQLTFGGSFSQTVEIESRRSHRWLIEHMSIEGNVELSKEPVFSGTELV